MNPAVRFVQSVVALVSCLIAFTVTAEAAPTAAEITGEIERLTLNDPSDVYSGGVMIVGGSQVILPKNLLIDLPANRLSLQQIFDQAPAACKATGESGLAKADRCNASGTGGFATLSGVHSNAGNIIAGDVLIEKGKETVAGVISYISYTDGYFRVNGIPNDPATGVMVRLNDPTGRHTIQQGSGCAGGPNCSPDPRFTLDPDNYTNAFSSGYPLCIPSTTVRPFPGLPALTGIPAVPAQNTQAATDGTGDLFCPATNRTPGAAVEPAVYDSRVFTPIMIGDSVNAEGNYETIGGARFLSAHTTRVNKALSTKNQSGQPDYMFLEEVFIEAPSFQNQRARTLIIGFTTLAPTDVDFWTIHRDPTSNTVHEFPLASIQGCDIAAGAGSCSSQGLVGAGANIFRIRYDVDFLLAAQNDPKYPGGARDDLNPCLQLRASPRFTVSNPGICGSGITLANNFGILSPIPHEIQARTGHLLDSPAGSLTTLDIRGNQATNGQYLFPFGMNLGGIETADFLEIDINLLSTPRTFEGIPWNLDRRLSPSGCLKAGGCEGTPQPLDPFPFTGLDPRTQADFLAGGQPGGTPKGSYSDTNFTASVLSNASNRVFSYVDATIGKFNGNSTLLPCASGLFPASCPPDPPLTTINPTPFLSIFPPIADEDAATTTAGVPVTINVIANDFPVFGTIDPASVAIASTPASGTAVANANGTITYTPTATFTAGTVTFTYTVANNYGSVSLPGTVTVTILGPPTANDDAATVQANGVSAINVVANDTGAVNLASIAISTTTGGTATANANGTVTYTAPDTPGIYSFTYTVQNTSPTPLTSNVATVTVTVTAPTPATGVTASVTPDGTQTVGNPVTITAAGQGGTGSYEYRFYVNDGGTFYLIQPYSTSGTCTWFPGKPGVYDFFVEVRAAGTNVLRDAYTNIFAYVVTSPAATGVSLNSSLPSPQAVGTPMTFTAQGSGGTGTYEYRFWLNSGAGFSVVQDYGTTSTWTYTPAAAGIFDVFVEVRIQGSAVNRDAYNNILGYRIE